MPFPEVQCAWNKSGGFYVATVSQLAERFDSTIVLQSDDSSVCVYESSREGPNLRAHIKATVSAAGKVRYTIEGAGEGIKYKHLWQVSRALLEPLLFPHR